MLLTVPRFSCEDDPKRSLFDVARGPNQVRLAAERAATNYTGGRAICFERVTSIFSPETHGWRLLHRHADPITTVQPADSELPK